MSEEEEVQVKFQLFWDRRVQVRLRYFASRLLGPPSPKPGDAVDVGVDCKGISLQTPTHDDESRFGTHALVAHQLLHSVLVAFLEEVVEVPLAMAFPDLLEHGHNDLGLLDVETSTVNGILQLFQPTGNDFVVRKDRAVDFLHAVHCTLSIAPTRRLAQDCDDHSIKDERYSLGRVWVFELLVYGFLMHLFENAVGALAFLAGGSIKVGIRRRGSMKQP